MIGYNGYWSNFRCRKEVPLFNAVVPAASLKFSIATLVSRNYKRPSIYRVVYKAYFNILNVRPIDRSTDRQTRLWHNKCHTSLGCGLNTWTAYGRGCAHSGRSVIISFQRWNIIFWCSCSFRFILLIVHKLDFWVSAFWYSFSLCRHRAHFKRFTRFFFKVVEYFLCTSQQARERLLCTWKTYGLIWMNRRDVYRQHIFVESLMHGGSCPSSLAPLRAVGPGRGVTPPTRRFEVLPREKCFKLTSP